MALATVSGLPTSSLDDPDSDDGGLPKKASLMGLPTELFDMILERALLSDSPIELSPFKDSCTEGPNFEAFTALQYQHALNFQQRGRPALGLLAVNKHLRTEASKVYYGKNVFRFSSGYGWLVLARFFDLIGKDNLQLLRHITIVHPIHHENVTFTNYEDFFVRHLSPFGMTDLSNYAGTYLSSQGGQNELIPAQDPLTTIRDIRNLESLDFIFYGEDWTRSDRLEILRPALTNESFDRGLTWDHPPNRQITLINLSPQIDLDPRVGMLKLSDAESAPINASWRYCLPGTVEAAQSIAASAYAKGWKIVDYAWCSRTGVWPLHSDQVEPAKELENYVEDLEGWRSREKLEARLRWYFYQSDGSVWGIWPGEEVTHLTYQHKVPHATVKQEDCVRCWRSGGFGACVCEDRPTLLPDKVFFTNELLVGNPGTPIQWDAKEQRFAWKKSWAVQDAERALNMWLWRCMDDRIRRDVEEAWRVEPLRQDFAENTERVVASGNYVSGKEDRITKVDATAGVLPTLNWALCTPFNARMLS